MPNNSKATQQAKKAAPQAASNNASVATQPLNLQLPKQPLYGAPSNWPSNSIKPGTTRAYCYMVAKALAAQMPNGYTTYQLAQAFAANQNQPGATQPAGGWGTPQKPSAAARQKANWFAKTAQWLAQVSG